MHIWSHILRMIRFLGGIVKNGCFCTRAIVMGLEEHPWRWLLVNACTLDNPTWQWKIPLWMEVLVGKSHIYIYILYIYIYIWLIFHCHVWLPEGKCINMFLYSVDWGHGPSIWPALVDSKHHLTGPRVQWFSQIFIPSLGPKREMSLIIEMECVFNQGSRFLSHKLTSFFLHDHCLKSL